MKSFVFHNPTRIIFGVGNCSKLGENAKLLGTNAIFVYGKESIKNSGLYDNIVNQLKQNNVKYIEHGGVKSNPSLDHVRIGVKKAKKYKVDFVIAVGGGSVIDEAKVIAAGALSDQDVWDFFERKSDIKSALPIITVLTLPATGSEMNWNTVVTNDKTQDKFGLANPHFYPKVSILDPELTVTIPKKYTAASSVDIISHLTESYFNNNGGWTPIQERYVEGLVKTVIEATDKIMIDPKDLEARSVIMWSATLAWNGLNLAGIGEFTMPCHALEHPMSAVYDIPHGSGLAILTPAWLYAKLDVLTPKIAQFARQVFGIDEKKDIIAAKKGVDMLKVWFAKIGAPTNFREAGIEFPDIAKLTELTMKAVNTRGIKGLDKNFIEQVYISCI